MVGPRQATMAACVGLIRLMRVKKTKNVVVAYMSFRTIRDYYVEVGMGVAGCRIYVIGVHSVVPTLRVMVTIVTPGVLSS